MAFGRGTGGRTRRRRIGPTGGKSRNESPYLGGSLWAAITSGGGARSVGSGRGRACVLEKAASGLRGSMTVELYKDEKLMAVRVREPGRRRIGFCPNPQSLRPLMTARHDPPGKILPIAEHATSNIQTAYLGSTIMLATARSRPGPNGALWDAVCQAGRYHSSRESIARTTDVIPRKHRLAAPSIRHTENSTWPLVFVYGNVFQALRRGTLPTPWKLPRNWEYLFHREESRIRLRLRKIEEVQKSEDSSVARLG